MTISNDLPAVARANGEPVPTTVESAAAESHHASRLAQLVVQAVLSDWKFHGVEVIAAVRRERPLEFLKLVISLFPKEAAVKEDRFDALSDEQLAGQLTSVLARLESAGIGPGDCA